MCQFAGAMAAIVNPRMLSAVCTAAVSRHRHRMLCVDRKDLGAYAQSQSTTVEQLNTTLDGFCIWFQGVRSLTGNYCRDTWRRALCPQRDVYSSSLIQDTYLRAKGSTPVSLRSQLSFGFPLTKRVWRSVEMTFGILAFSIDFAGVRLHEIRTSWCARLAKELSCLEICHVSQPQ